MHEENAYILGH